MKQIYIERMQENNFILCMGKINVIWPRKLIVIASEQLTCSGHQAKTRKDGEIPRGLYVTYIIANEPLR